MALTLTENNFESEVLNSKIPVLVDFWAPWCGPCRSMAPVIEDLAKEFEGKVKVGKVNVDENRNLAGTYGIMSIPTLIFFKNGEKVDQLVGYTSKSALVKKFDSLVEGQ
jgi:thioredoxin 1